MVWTIPWIQMMIMMVGSRYIQYRARNKCQTLGIPDELDPDDDNDGIPDLGMKICWKDSIGLNYLSFLENYHP